MLLSFYILFAFFCATLLNKCLRIDPLLIALPCALLVIGDHGVLLTVYASVLPVAFISALGSVVINRSGLNVEHVTRIGAGLSLGAFIGVEIVFLLSFSFFALLSALAILSLLSVVIHWLHWSVYDRIPRSTALLFGLPLGCIQFLGLGSGAALLGGRHAKCSDADLNVLWLLGALGGVLGMFALPSDVRPMLDWQLLSFGMLGVVFGLFVSHRINISAFESKLLNWVVLLMCLSVWIHLFIKHFVLH